MSLDKTQVVEQRVEELLGYDLKTLLDPISDEKPTGKYLRGNGVYSAIQEARRFDEDLPQGVWQFELKRADWDKVSDIATNAISQKTKDLQIGIWLLEAQIYRNGFKGIAPCIRLLKSMCEAYWEEIHPCIQDGDIEYRINPVVWANEKLLPVLRMVPLTKKGDGQPELSWADWEMAQRNEYQKETHAGTLEKDAILVASFLHHVAATPSEFYHELYQDIQLALNSIEDFTHLLDDLCGEDSPSLGQIVRLLEEIASTLVYLLGQRGVLLDKESFSLAGSESEESDSKSENVSSSEAGGADGGGAGGARGAITNRAQAYQALAEAAEYLVRIEPHSPSPYLVKKAIEWGNLSTPELYDELFVKYQGQLNIFEVLGLQLEGS